MCCSILLLFLPIHIPTIQPFIRSKTLRNFYYHKTDCIYCSSFQVFRRTEHIFSSSLRCTSFTQIFFQKTLLNMGCAVQFCSYFYPSTSPPSNPSLGAKLFAIFIIIKPIASIARPSKSSGEQNTYLAVHYVALHSPKFSACFYCLNLAENFAKYGMCCSILLLFLPIHIPTIQPFIRSKTLRNFYYHKTDCIYCSSFQVFRRTEHIFSSSLRCTSFTQIFRLFLLS